MEMELELGLALPTSPLNPIDMLDLNSYASDSLSWPLLKLGPTNSAIQTNICSSCSGGIDNKKRSSDEKKNVPKTLQLLLWSTTEQPDDDDPIPSSQDLHHHSSPFIFKNDEESLVGWPPLKTPRKKRLRHQIPNEVVGGVVGRASRSSYVKVKMEGVAIARKIDLKLHHSFETLSSSLMRMFCIWGTAEGNRNSFKLAYQDPQGDWLLAEDVPWRTFIRSLRSLKLIKS